MTYLKIDIEGGEYNVMRTWRENDLHLPLQVRHELVWIKLYKVNCIYTNRNHDCLHSVTNTLAKHNSHGYFY